MEGGAPPPCLGLQGDGDGQSHVPVEVKGAPGPGRQGEVVQLVDVHCHVPSQKSVALTLGLDAQLVALDQDQQPGVQEAGAPGVAPCLGAGGHHHPDPAAHGLDLPAGADEVVQDPLSCLSAAVAPDPGVLANGPNQEALLHDGGPNPVQQLEDVLDLLEGGIARHQGPENVQNPALCLEDTDHLSRAKRGQNLHEGVEGGQSLNLPLEV